MLKPLRLMLCVLLAVVLAPGFAFAQTGTVSGKVLDGVTGDPLPGANVTVKGTQSGASTNVDGEYTITNVPAGSRVFVAHYIGYKSTEMTTTVSAGAVVELNFDLKETVLQLDEVVVTGAGVASARKKLGNTVTSISTKSLEDAPVSNFSEMLSSRQAGIQVNPSNGLNGTGSQIRIRGSASLSQSNEPIVYIDGMRVNNGTGNTLDGAGGASRLDDINPDAIERVEVLKGAAAATLYGTQASNGVIQIFTKKGSFSKPRFTLETAQTAMSYPDVYKPNVGFARDAETAARMSDVYGFNVQPYQLVSRNNVSSLFNTGFGQTYSLNVSGGGTGVTYFASGRFEKSDGPLNPQAEDFAIASRPGETFEPGNVNDLVRRAQFTANVNIVPNNKLNFRVGSGYSNVHLELPRNGNNIYGVVSLAMFGKPEFVAENNAHGARAFMTTREATYQTGKEDTEHFYVNMSSNYKMSNDLFFESTFGLDVTQSRAFRLRPFAYNVDGFTGSDVNGSLNVNNNQIKEWTLDLKGNWNKKLSGSLSSRLIIGFQGFKTETNNSSGFGTTFPAVGLETLSATDAPTRSAGSSFSQIINAGWFADEQISFKDYLFVTAGIRFDANSAFGSNFSTQAYPKLSFSFLPATVFPKITESGLLSTLRLRAALGTSGLQPGAFDYLTTFSPASSAEGPGVRPNNLGNQDLKPEISTEIEVGFEAGLFEDKAGIEFTYWDRTVKDALIARQFAPSGGFLNTQLDNIGETNAYGVDIGLNVSAVQKENLDVDFFLSAAYIQETVTDLGGAPPLKIGGSYPRYRNYIWPGYAPGAHFGAKLDRDLDYPIDINGDGAADSKADLLAFFADPQEPTAFKPVLLDAEYIDPVSGELASDKLLHYLGNSTPDWSGSFGLKVSFLKNFRISTNFEYKFGNFFVNNLTDAFRKSHGLIGRNTPDAAKTELALLNPDSTPEQRLEAANSWVREFLALSPYSGLNTIEKADFVRWRELSFSYDIPRTIAARFGLRNATVSLAGRNIMMFSGYSGIDQEMNAIGRNGNSGTDAFLTGVDAFGYPIPRQFTFNVRVKF